VFDGKSRMDFNFFDPDGKGTLTLRGNQAHRPVKVRAPGGIRISGEPIMTEPATYDKAKVLYLF